MRQGSPEWAAARAGRATASRFSDVMAKIKSGEAAVRRNYRAELVVERMTGIPVEGFMSKEMMWGIDQEPEARARLEEETGVLVEEIGFVAHPEVAAGASPDGLIGDDGGLEIKCPNTSTHIGYLLGGMTPDHVPQVQGNMWMTGRAWWLFVSFDPRMPEKLQLYKQMIPRDDAYIRLLEAEVRKFLREVDETVAKLTKIAEER